MTVDLPNGSSGSLPATSSGHLPDGPRGRLLALALTVAVLAALVEGAVVPLIGFYDAREDAIAEQRAAVAHMSMVASALPALRKSLDDAASRPPPPASLIEGDSDAVAAAHLQETVQAMAETSGGTLSSLETLPAEAADRYRKIALHVALSAPYPALVGLLRAIGAAEPRLFVDDLHLQGPLLTTNQAEAPMDASFTVIAFRAATEAAR